MRVKFFLNKVEIYMEVDTVGASLSNFSEKTIKFFGHSKHLMSTMVFLETYIHWLVNLLKFYELQTCKVVMKDKQLHCQYLCLKGRVLVYLTEIGSTL